MRSRGVDTGREAQLLPVPVVMDVEAGPTFWAEVTARPGAAAASLWSVTGSWKTFSISS